MSFFFVAWLSFNCPGGFLSGLVPAAVRPFACAPEVKLERFDPAQYPQAQSLVRVAGPTARIYRCDARRCREIGTRWRTEVDFKE